uniref:Uncharacterized protein n=1 Tax=Ciona savignyi TaxID=51511 RepID=H2YG90_CIOSA
MNWVGGVHNKIRLHNKEQQKQKEFFECRQVQNKIEKSRNRSKKGVSRDILNLACITKSTRPSLSDSQIAKAETVSKKPKRIELKRRKYDDPRSHLNRKPKRVILASGNSPTSNPSLVELDDGSEDHRSAHSGSKETSLWTTFCDEDDFKLVLPSYQSTPMQPIVQSKSQRGFPDPNDHPHMVDFMLSPSTDHRCSLQQAHSTTIEPSTSDYYSLGPLISCTTELESQDEPQNLMSSLHGQASSSDDHLIASLLHDEDEYQHDISLPQILDNSPRYTDQGNYINKNVEYPRSHEGCPTPSVNNEQNYRMDNNIRQKLSHSLPHSCPDIYAQSSQVGTSLNRFIPVSHRPVTEDSMTSLFGSPGNIGTSKVSTKYKMTSSGQEFSHYSVTSSESPLLHQYEPFDREISLDPKTSKISSFSVMSNQLAMTSPVRLKGVSNHQSRDILESERFQNVSSTSSTMTSSATTRCCSRACSPIQWPVCDVSMQTDDEVMP